MMKTLLPNFMTPRGPLLTKNCYLDGKMEHIILHQQIFDQLEHDEQHWNIHFYPSVGQLSRPGGGIAIGSNAIWFILLIMNLLLNNLDGIFPFIGKLLSLLPKLPPPFFDCLSLVDKVGGGGSPCQFFFGVRHF